MHDNNFSNRIIEISTMCFRQNNLYIHLLPGLFWFFSFVTMYIFLCAFFYYPHLFVFFACMVPILFSPFNHCSMFVVECVNKTTHAVANTQKKNCSGIEKKLKNRVVYSKGIQNQKKKICFVLLVNVNVNPYQYFISQAFIWIRPKRKSSLQSKEN